MVGVKGGIVADPDPFPVGVIVAVADSVIFGGEGGASVAER